LTWIPAQGGDDNGWWIESGANGCTAIAWPILFRDAGIHYFSTEKCPFVDNLMLRILPDSQAGS
jgi:hypothetical protein